MTISQSHGNPNGALGGMPGDQCFDMDTGNPPSVPNNYFVCSGGQLWIAFNASGAPSGPWIGLISSQKGSIVVSSLPKQQLPIAPKSGTNPFKFFSNLMTQYQGLLDTPIEGLETADWVIYAGAKIKAVIGAFEFREIITPGGLSPRLYGQAIIQKANLPRTVKFSTGQKLQAYQVGGTVKNCQIESVEDDFLEIRLNLWHQAQNA